LPGAGAASSRGLLARVPPEVPVYVAPHDVMSRIVGFPIHRGLLAIGRRGPERSAADLLRDLPPAATVLGLIGLANHDNVGGIFRNAAAFGAAAVLLDGTSCDPLYRKAIRVSVGAALIVPFARGGTAGELLAALDSAGFEAVALSPGGTEPLSAYRRAPRTALLLGTEGPGLPSDILARTRTVRIPMAAGFDSLNAATASGIALHHLVHAPEPLSRTEEGQG
jgi:tRNA G18 (ribose-2'-O)-methylase SpoU